MASIVGTNSLAPELVLCPGQSLRLAVLGSSAPFLGVGKLPESCPRALRRKFPLLPVTGQTEEMLSFLPVQMPPSLRAVEPLSAAPPPPFSLAAPPPMFWGEPETSSASLHLGAKSGPLLVF